jgi:hypothetical protein
VLRRERGHLRLDFVLHPLGQRLAIENPRAHAATIRARTPLRRSTVDTVICAPLSRVRDHQGLVDLTL